MNAARERLEQARLFYVGLLCLLLPVQRRQRHEPSHSLVHRGANLWRVLLKRTMSKGVDGCSLLEPLSYLLRPCVKQGAIDLHTRMADIAQESEIGCDGDLKREIGLAFARLQRLLLLSRTGADRPCIH